MGCHLNFSKGWIKRIVSLSAERKKGEILSACPWSKMTFCLGGQSLEEGVEFVTLCVLCDLRHVSRRNSVLLWRKGTEVRELERSPWLLGVLSTFSGVYWLAAMSKDLCIKTARCKSQLALNVYVTSSR